MRHSRCCVLIPLILASSLSGVSADSLIFVVPSGGGVFSYNLEHYVQQVNLDWIDLHPYIAASYSLGRGFYTARGDIYMFNISDSLLNNKKIISTTKAEGWSPIDHYPIAIEERSRSLLYMVPSWNGYPTLNLTSIDNPTPSSARQFTLPFKSADIFALALDQSGGLYAAVNGQSLVFVSDCQSGRPAVTVIVNNTGTQSFITNVRIDTQNGLLFYTDIGLFTVGVCDLQSRNCKATKWSSGFVDDVAPDPVNKILYYSYASATSEIWSMNYDFSNQQRVLSFNPYVWGTRIIQLLYTPYQG